MFIVCVCAVLLPMFSLTALVADQPPCVFNADGTMSCPVFAPQLPQSVLAQAVAAKADPTPDDNQLSLRQRREMGFTRLAVIRATTRLARAGQLPSTRGLSGEDLAAAREEIKDAVAAEIMGDNVQAWASAGADWESFFAQLLAFLEKLMPIILQLISIFGGV
jgi:hypothetical protein